MERFNSSHEQEPRKDNWAKKFGRAVVRGWEDYVNSPNYIPPAHSGMAFAMFYAERERIARLERESQLDDTQEIDNGEEDDKSREI